MNDRQDRVDVMLQSSRATLRKPQSDYSKPPPTNTGTVTDIFPLRDTSTAPIRARSRPPALIAVGVAAFAAAVMLGSVFAYVMFFRKTIIVGYCELPGCLEHVTELRAAMDSAVEPCDNFYKFVCGSWKPQGGERNMIERIYAKPFTIAVTELGKDKEPVLPIVQQFYKSCTRKRTESETRAEVQEFKEFKQSLGLMWPEMPQPADKDFLRILLTMTIRWNINIFFNARAWRELGSSSHTLFISRGALESAWTEKGFAELVTQHCGLLRADGCRESLPNLTAVVQNMHEAVPASSPDTTRETAFSLGDISQLIRGREPWEIYLNEAYENRFSWDRDKIVVLEDALILRNLDGLLSKHMNVSDPLLLMGLSWVFIQTHLWIFTGQPQLRQAPEVLPHGLKSGELACLKLTEGPFGLAVSAQNIYERYDATIRECIADLFFKIKDSVKTQFTDASWINDAVRQKYYPKLDAMALEMMPPETFFVKERLEKLYTGFPAITTSFVQNYIRVSKAFQQKLDDEAFVDVYAKRLEGLGRRRVASLYLHYYNTVSMGLGVLEPPVLHADGSFALKFGSAGTLLAASVVRSFDKLGVQVNHKGEKEKWWVPSDGYDERLKCDLRASTARADVDDTTGNLSQVTSAPLYSLLLAVSTSFQAYRTAIGKNKVFDDYVDDFRLKGMEEYSDDQVFFMTYCLMTCGGDSNSDMCNVPMRHSHFFSRAFKCPKGASMNPNKKCLFF